ncbi:MAG: DMT family transporter [Hyphomicrobiales bacterium]
MNTRPSRSGPDARTGRLRATAVGAVAIPIWSSLAALAQLNGGVPPLQLLAVSFAIAGTIGLVYLLWSGVPLSSLLDVPPGAWLLGVGGLFGYHLLYFLAFRMAPALEVNLVNYLWPLLIVLFSALPVAGAGGLTWRHLAGAAMGFAGTALILTGGTASETGGHLAGYLCAMGAAIIWAAYSVLSRRYASVPSHAVAGYCLVTAALAAASHLVLETTLWPQGAAQWAVLAAMGAGPVGLAFYFWDHGVKHGDVRFLGVACYAIPLLSTLLLIALGLGEASAGLWIACGLIVGGAGLAARSVGEGD